MIIRLELIWLNLIAKQYEMQFPVLETPDQASLAIFRAVGRAQRATKG